jgi:hypothetical protein
VELLVVVMVLIVVAAASAVSGADSRDGNDWIVHRRP